MVTLPSLYRSRVCNKRADCLTQRNKGRVRPRHDENLKRKRLSLLASWRASRPRPTYKRVAADQSTKSFKRPGKI